MRPLTSSRPQSRSRAQTTQPGAFRSASAGFPPCPRPVPVPCGKCLKAACPPQKASEIFPKGLLPFQVPAQSSPDAGGNLQILPTGFCSDSYSNPLGGGMCPVKNALERRFNKGHTEV